MGSDDGRSAAAAGLAHDALVALAAVAGDHARDLLVLGGLTPPGLTASAPVGHHGTTDLDLLVEVGLVYDDDDVDLAWVERALDAAGFRPRTGWQWEWSRAPVRLDLVCDIGSAPALARSACRAVRARAR